MPKKTEQKTMPKANTQSIQINLPQQHRAGVYANAVSVMINDNEIVLDMGYIMPNVKPTTIEVVSRVNMSHRTAQQFVSILQNSILDYRSKKGSSQQ